jgi:hypothetical protein
MDRINVISSDIKSIGYSVEVNILEIEFHSGNIYQYFDVPLEVFNSLIDASSQGKYFNQYIRKVYKAEKIR